MHCCIGGDIVVGTLQMISPASSKMNKMVVFHLPMRIPWKTTVWGGSHDREGPF